MLCTSESCVGEKFLILLMILTQGREEGKLQFAIFACWGGHCQTPRASSRLP